jgi:hypothetical protein
VPVVRMPVRRDVRVHDHAADRVADTVPGMVGGTARPMRTMFRLVRRVCHEILSGLETYTV